MIEVGRRRWSRSKMGLMAKDFRAPGLSQTEFAHMVAIHPFMVCKWV